MRNVLKKTALLLALLTVVSILPTAGLATGKEADACLNADYTFELTKCTGREGKLSDYAYKSSVRVDPGSVIRMTGADAGEKHANAIYLSCIKVPESFSVVYRDASGNTIRTEEYGTENDPVYSNCLFLHEYAMDIPEKTESIEFVFGSRGFVSELRLYADMKEVPETAEKWEPPYEKADILFVVAHPDDEHLMMGGILPIYAAERGKKVQMVYMTANQNVRKSEALHGLWLMGVRNIPVFLDLKDKRTETLSAGIEVWEKAGQDALGILVEQIRRFKPEIVVSHDPEGEYGHGAHRATSMYVEKAVMQAADPACYPETAEKYGVWETRKLYLHLLGSDKTQTVLPIDEPLDAFDGKTAFEMAQLGYMEHEGSQGATWMKLLRSREYDCGIYGLAISAVGADELKNDLFEHLEEEQ